MPIRSRLALSAAAITFVLVAVGGALFVRSFRSGQIDSLDRGVVAHADTLARQLRAPTAALDFGAAGSRSSVATGEIVAQVLERDGTVADTTREAGARSILDASSLEQARRGKTFTEVELDRDREPFRVLAQPRIIAGRARVLVVGASLEETNGAIGRVENGVLIGGGAAVALAALGGWVLATAAMRPVEKMRRRAASISSDDSTARLPVPATHDEIAALAVTMNELLGRLHGALDRQREFVADAGHELRTPLATLQTELELAQRGARTPEELQDAIDHAAVETHRLARLADELLFLARGDSDRLDARRVPVDLEELVVNVLRGCDVQAHERGVTLRHDVPSGAVVPLDGDLVRRAVENLVSNAMRFAPKGSTVLVRAAIDANALDLSVCDEGTGFPPEFLPDAFERFRRADDARTRADGGSGLGLAIVAEVARAHAGSAVAANLPGGGAIVSLHLPVSV